MDTTETTPIRLFSPRQIGLAAFIGSPVAACWCITRNYRMLGNSGSAEKWFAWGCCGSLILLLLFCLIPGVERLPHYIIPLAYTIALQEVAKRIQGDAIAKHISTGGRLASWWLLIGISLLFLIIVFGLMIATFILVHGIPPDPTPPQTTYQQ